jgi:hypothetical protein
MAQQLPDPGGTVRPPTDPGLQKLQDTTQKIIGKIDLTNTIVGILKEGKIDMYMREAIASVADAIDPTMHNIVMGTPMYGVATLLNQWIKHTLTAAVTADGKLSHQQYNNAINNVILLMARSTQSSSAASHQNSPQSTTLSDINTASSQRNQPNTYRNAAARALSPTSSPLQSISNPTPGPAVRKPIQVVKAATSSRGRTTMQTTRGDGNRSIITTTANTVLAHRQDKPGFAAKAPCIRPTDTVVVAATQMAILEKDNLVQPLPLVPGAAVTISGATRANKISYPTQSSIPGSAPLRVNSLDFAFAPAKFEGRSPLEVAITDAARHGNVLIPVDDAVQGIMTHLFRSKDADIAAVRTALKAGISHKPTTEATPYERVFIDIDRTPRVTRGNNIYGALLTSNLGTSTVYRHLVPQMQQACLFIAMTNASPSITLYTDVTYDGNSHVVRTTSFFGLVKSKVTMHGTPVFPKETAYPTTHMCYVDGHLYVEVSGTPNGMDVFQQPAVLETLLANANGNEVGDFLTWFTEQLNTGSAAEIFQNPIVVTKASALTVMMRPSARNTAVTTTASAHPPAADPGAQRTNAANAENANHDAAPALPIAAPTTNAAMQGPIGDVTAPVPPTAGATGAETTPNMVAMNPDADDRTAWGGTGMNATTNAQADNDIDMTPSPATEPGNPATPARNTEVTPDNPAPPPPQQQQTELVHRSLADKHEVGGNHSKIGIATGRHAVATSGSNNDCMLNAALRNFGIQNNDPTKERLRQAMKRCGDIMLKKLAPNKSVQLSAQGDMEVLDPANRFYTSFAEIQEDRQDGEKYNNQINATAARLLAIATDKNVIVYSATRWPDATEPDGTVDINKVEPDVIGIRPGALAENEPNSLLRMEPQNCIVMSHEGNHYTAMQPPTLMELPDIFSLPDIGPILETRAQQVIDLTHVFSRHPHWDDPATAHVPPDAHDPEFDREHRERKRAALANARTSGKKGKTVTPTSLPRPQVAGGAPPPNKHAAFGLLTPTRLPRREKRQDRTPPSSPSTAQDDSNDDSSSDGWQTVGSGKKNHKGRKPNSGPKSPSN